MINAISPGIAQSDSCQHVLETFLTYSKELSSPNSVFITSLYIHDFEDFDKASDSADRKSRLLINLKGIKTWDWRKFRDTSFASNKLRDEITLIATDIVTLIQRARQPRIGNVRSDSMYKERLAEITSNLSSIIAKVETAYFSQKFRIDLIRKLVQNAKDEVEQLCKPKGEYEQNLSVEENFIMRAGAIFQSAHRLHAVSMDETSSFWLADDQRERAQKYTARQPKSTKRLFVFSNFENAARYRNVLAAHGKKYGTTGGVLLCSRTKYFQFLSSNATKEDLENLKTRDFAMLEFDDGEETEYYEAVLTKTKLMCRYTTRPEGYRQRIIEIMDDVVRNIDPGESHPSGIMRWDPKFHKDSERWTQALRRMFDLHALDEKSLLNGSVYHVVLISSGINYERLVGVVNEVVKPILTNLKKKDRNEPLLREFWFGSRDRFLSEMSVIDGKFGGKLSTKNQIVTQYPHCFIMKFDGIDSLREYYEDELHSNARKQLYSLFDEDIGPLYHLIDSGGMCQRVDNNFKE